MDVEEYIVGENHGLRWGGCRVSRKQRVQGNRADQRVRPTRILKEQSHCYCKYCLVNRLPVASGPAEGLEIGFELS